MDNYQELISEATVIKNENAPRENTANRIGSAFINVINAMKGIDDDLDTYIAAINSTFTSLRSEIQNKLNAAAIQWANDIRNAILALTTKDIKENGRSQETINADVAAQFIRDAAQWKADIQTAINGLTTKDIRENGKTQEKINAEVSAKFTAAAAQWASDIKDAILALTTKDIKEGGRSQETINAEVAAQFVAAAAQWADDIDNGFTKRKIKGFTTKPDDLNSASDIGIYYMNVNAGYNKLRGTGLLSVGINFSNVVYQTFLSTNIPVYDNDGNITSFNSKACILSRSYQNGAWTQWKEQIPELSTVNIRENGRTQEEINKETKESLNVLVNNIYDIRFLDTVLKYDNSDGLSHYVNKSLGVNSPSPIRENYWAINVYEVMAGIEYQIVIPKTVDSSVCRNVSFALTKGEVSPDALFDTDGTTGTGDRYETKYIPSQNGFILISFMYSTVDCTVVYGEPTVRYRNNKSKIDKLEDSIKSIINTNVIKVNSVEDMSESGKIYSIETELILDDNLTIPRDSTLYFDGGSIDGNGYSIDFNGCYLDGSVSLVDVIPNGKVANLILNINMFGTKSITNSNYVVDAFALASMSGADLVLDKKTYTITKPVFVYNKVNVVGNGCTFNVSGSHDFAFVFGTDMIKGASLAWEGSFSHVNINVIAGRFNQIVGLFNACNCEVAYCNVDCSRPGAECYNKIIGRVNNANVVINNGTILNNYHIHHNTTRVHEENGGEDKNNCECIGIEGVTDVNIEYNTIWNTRDDLGVHACQNVSISHNTLNNAYDGRIFCSNSKEVEISYNYIYYKGRGGNGIFVGHEDVYSQLAERYKIIGNCVNMLEVPTTPFVWSGIYIEGVRYIDVIGNTLIGNFNQAKINIVEHQKSSGPTFDTYPQNDGYLVPCFINIENNSVNSIYYSCGTRIVDNVRVINNNIKRSLFLNNPAILIGGNKIEGFYASLYHNIQGSYADFRPEFIIERTPLQTEEPMLLDRHIANFIAPCDLVWTGRFSSYMDKDTVTGTYLAYLYVDGVKVENGTATINSCTENKATNAIPTIIKRGSKISVTIRRNVASENDANYISYIPLMYRN